MPMIVLKALLQAVVLALFATAILLYKHKNYLSSHLRFGVKRKLNVIFAYVDVKPDTLRILGSHVSRYIYILLLVCHLY